VFGRKKKQEDKDLEKVETKMVESNIGEKLVEAKKPIEEEEEKQVSVEVERLTAIVEYFNKYYAPYASSGEVACMQRVHLESLSLDLQMAVFGELLEIKGLLARLLEKKEK